ncbi:GGDEF domain-containing protein [Nitrogeniibacter aestuarii]|uniref:GGDEF domain-containing protein n=1 Tax=Nitrogeniibacter aestuarii TaxID=2815343 RepID=UPI001D108E1F|nr:GGDEF domain-containing protein [Nitrogeniibacter aestuarii]
MERVPPTPDNYRALYHRISGTKDDDCFPAQAFKRIISQLPSGSPPQLKFVRQFEQAVVQRSWPPIARALIELSTATDSGNLAWSSLLQQLIEQLDRRHANLTQARKRESLAHVLKSTGGDASVLHTRLGGLVRSWSSNSEADDAQLVPDTPASETQASAAAEKPESTALVGSPTDQQTLNAIALATLAPELGAELELLMHRGVRSFLSDLPALADAVDTVGKRLAANPSRTDLPELQASLEELALKLEWAGEDQASVRESLTALLQLVVQNISALVIDDRWLSGQLAVLHQAFSQPLDIRSLDEVERRLRDVIDQQGKLKQELSNAQSRLKQMLAGFIDRLADMSDSAGTFHDTLEQCAGEIEQAEDISQLSDVVENLLRETRAAQESAKRSSEDLQSLRDQVDLANAEIAKLQNELHHTSEMVRHDPLTGALNRKGLDEALKREIARAQRRSSCLCIGLLDVDNFKKINDNHGHHAGDAALLHLTEVVKENLRPQDSLGRFGGEEFVVILPDTDAEDAVKAMHRLQRALTNKYFLTGGQKLLITFSAGVARLEDDEPAEAAIDRADKAMYRAKKAGKNRVMMA